MDAAPSGPLIKGAWDYHLTRGAWDADVASGNGLIVTGGAREARGTTAHSVDVVVAVSRLAVTLRIRS